VGYWPFDDGTGNTAHDCSGHFLDGILVNGPVWTAGRHGTALAFQTQADAAAAQSVNLGNATPLQFHEAFTISMWIRLEQGFDPNVVLVNKGSFGGEGFALGLLGGAVTFSVVLLDGAAHQVTGSTIVAGEWTHVAGVFDPGRAVSVYRGSVAQLVAVDRDASAFVPANDWPMGVGFYNHGNHQNSQLDGVVDDVRVFGRALSAQEIAALASE
jgi:hypothetical protein